MKKFLSIILALILVFCSVVPSFADAFSGKLYTTHYLVQDLTTGEVLASENADDAMYPASLTKMMTALVAMDYIRKNHIELTDGIVIDGDCLGLWDDYFGLKNGEVFKWEDALNIMLVRSVNGMSVAIAKAVAGTTEEFAKLMNKKAEELGCTNSHFVNPHGLDNDDHYTSANDLAKISTALMNDEYLSQIVAQESYTYSQTKYRASGTVLNTNLLINGESKIYVGNTLTTTKYTNAKIIGLKTGTEDKAGYCIAAVAEKDGTKILVIDLKSSENLGRYVDAHMLFNWAFNNFKTVKLASKGDKIDEVKVKKGEFNHVEAVISEDIYITMPKEAAESSLKLNPTLDELAIAPLSAGAVLGSVAVLESGSKIKTINAIAKTDINEGGILSNFFIEDVQAEKIFKTVKIVLLVIVILLIAILCLRAYNKAKARKKKELRARAKAIKEAREKAQWREQYDKDHKRQ